LSYPYEIYLWENLEDLSMGNFSDLPYNTMRCQKKPTIFKPKKLDFPQKIKQSFPYWESEKNTLSQCEWIKSS
jgi:hypothetical protein